MVISVGATTGRPLWFYGEFHQAAFSRPTFFYFVGATTGRPLCYTGNFIRRLSAAQPFFIKRLPKNFFNAVWAGASPPHPLEFRRLRTATSFFEKKLGKNLRRAAAGNFVTFLNSNILHITRPLYAATWLFVR